MKLVDPAGTAWSDPSQPGGGADSVQHWMAMATRCSRVGPRLAVSEWNGSMPNLVCSW